ncbi:hypothetical protein [Bacteroides sp. UBA939]|uniref:hypothetical protein n=1 Tax=Bacteroides sp. UBA939 TaxID=1946092 RepID=UPI0025B8D039|nr:hypothetical protein [Bacteroides sp. UBA939]
MKGVKDLVEEFRQRAIKHYKYSLEGDYKHGNAEIKGINKVYAAIKKQEELEELLQLIYSDTPEVVSLAATYCMKFSPEKCLEALNKLFKEDIPLISSGAKYAIQNWNNNKWYID